MRWRSPCSRYAGSGISATSLDNSVSARCRPSICDAPALLQIGESRVNAKPVPHLQAHRKYLSAGYIYTVPGACYRLITMEHIGIIGFGNMGEAIAAGLRRSSDGLGIAVMEPNQDRCDIANSTYKARIVNDTAEFFDFAEITVIAVKPQVVHEVVSTIRPNAKNGRFVSVVAGTRLDYFRLQLESDEVVRFMPNLAATVGHALVAVSYSEPIEQKTLDDAFSVAEAIGTRLIVPGKLMSAITGVSGSGLAFVFSFVHALALGGTRVGLTYKEALEAAIKTVEGAAALLSARSEQPIELLSRVISPAGTTIEGVNELEKGAFVHTVMEAVVAAARRADDLES